MANVLTCGVAVIDFVFYMKEFPNEAKKYRADNATIVGGGNAANASVAIQRLGGNSSLISRIGNDQIGDMIIAGLKNDHVDCSLVRKFEGIKSSFSSIFINNTGERQIMNYRDQQFPDSTEWFPKQIPDHINVILADNRWNRGAIDLLQKARHQRIPSIIDVERPIESELEPALTLASHITFSSEGLEEYHGVGNKSEQVMQIANNTGNWVCVTDGERGVIWSDGKSVEQFPAFSVEAKDTLGAGDTWHGAFALAIGEGFQINDAIRFASAAAALKCTKIGGRDSSPLRSEVEQFLKENDI